MKKVLIVCLVLSSTFLSCKKDGVNDLPLCISKRILLIKIQPVWNPPAQIYEYEYNGQIVYLISSSCCDKYNTLVDKNCKIICAPSGGITGKGDGKCPDFSEKAKLVRLVWRDERK